MVHCCVVDCCNASHKIIMYKETNVRIGYHTFPKRDKSPKRYRLWLDRISRKDFVPSSCTVVCSQHFQESDFQTSFLQQTLMPDPKMKLNLKRTAVPSLDLRGTATCSNDPPATKKSSVYLRKKQVTEIMEGVASTSGVTADNKSNADYYFDNIYEQDFIGNEDILASTPTRDEDGGTGIGCQCELGQETLKNVLGISSDSDQNAENSYNDPKDLSYFLPSDIDETGSASDSESESENDPECEDETNGERVKNTMFISFWSSLLILLSVCNQCASPVENIRRSTTGSMLTVKTTCKKGHNFTWRSQPLVKRVPLGNVLIAGAVYLSGLTFQATKTFADTLKLQLMSNWTFYKHVKAWVAPVIRDIWHSQRTHNLDELRSKDMPKVWVGGDGQYDSPGHSAKYCTYTVMDILTEKIIDFFIIQKGQVTGDLEKAACDRLMTRLVVDESIPITLFLSDRHRGIGLLMRTKFPDIMHEFDVWHMAKSLMKKIQASTKQSTVIPEWHRSIRNHLWWSSKTCDGNADLLVEKFQSLMHHVCDEHSWEGEGNLFNKCEHTQLDEEERATKMWITPNSHDYQLLRKHITDKAFIKDLRHTNHFCHTGGIESYHNVRLKYMPKRVHFTYDGMTLRSMLAILDHNANIGRAVTGESVRYSKATKKWVLRSKFEKKSNLWREDLLAKISDVASGISPLPCTQEADHPPIPQNIAAFPKPTLETLQNTRFKRFERL
jgi:THAP domain